MPKYNVDFSTRSDGGYIAIVKRYLYHCSF